MSDLYLHLGGQFDGKVRPVPSTERYTVPVREPLRMADYIIDPEKLIEPARFKTEDYELREFVFFGRVLRVFVAIAERANLPELAFRHLLSSAAKSTVIEEF